MIKQSSSCASTRPISNRGSTITKGYIIMGSTTSSNTSSGSLKDHHHHHPYIIKHHHHPCKGPSSMWAISICNLHQRTIIIHLQGSITVIYHQGFQQGHKHDHHDHDHHHSYIIKGQHHHQGCILLWQLQGSHIVIVISCCHQGQTTNWCWHQWQSTATISPFVIDNNDSCSP